ncbi:cytochrome c oxidase subunit 1 [Nowakowskiella sp. JEL0407]|nr:cytochrome c oxidase subunit 1 [Nowakowskiella sp. JEL0407]
MLNKVALDSALSYSTVKIVKVQDWILGLIHYVFLIGILAYVIVNTVTSQLYLRKSSPIASSVRFTAELNAAKLPIPSYCSAPEVSGCLFWGADDIVFPYAGEVNTIFITTKVTVATTIPLPSTCFTNSTETGIIVALNSKECTPQAYKDAPSKTSYYIANVEDITVMLDHNVRTQLSNTGTVELVLKDETSMDGKLVSACKDDKSLDIEFNKTRRDATYAKYKTRLDILTISELLHASSCALNSLDKVSNAPDTSPNETWRSTGMIVSVPINYENEVGDAKFLRYTYLPAQMNATKYRIQDHVNNPDGSTTYYKRYGIRIIATQFGSVGVFDFQVLLVNLVAGLALTKIASTLVDLLMLYFMPKRAKYKEAKFDEEFIDKNFAHAPSDETTRTRGPGPSITALTV